jgi:hypothetical protein
VLVFKVNTNHPDERVQNLIIVACKTECTAGSSGDSEITELLSHKYSEEIPTDELPLTDELAPVEYFNSFGQNLYRR